MNDDSSLILRGGCQCGAVRYEARGQPYHRTVCHCTTCRRTSGAPMVGWFSVAAAGFRFTQGQPRRFRSSAQALRSFCGDCGTPLTYEYGEKHIGLTIGALDRPADVRLSEQLASPARVPYFEDLAKLPVHRTDEPRAAAHLAGIVSYQHPDHDTGAWPPGR